MLGDTTAQYRWFALFYLAMMFLVFPGIVLVLSIAGWYVILAVGGPLLILFVIVVVINILQGKIPEKMGCLATWDFLPLWMHSLAPLDRLVSRCFTSCREDDIEVVEAIEMDVGDDEKPASATMNGHANEKVVDEVHNNAAYNYNNHL